MRLTSRDKYKLGPGAPHAKILFQTTYSNIFLSLLDLKNKVICFKSAGHIDDCKRKKNKKPLYNVGLLMEKLSIYLVGYNIKRIYFLFRSKRQYFYGHYFLAQFKLYGLIVMTFTYYLPIAHNGVRGRHIRYKKSHRRRRRKRRRK